MPRIKQDTPDTPEVAEDPAVEVVEEAKPRLRKAKEAVVETAVSMRDRLAQVLIPKGRAGRLTPEQLRAAADKRMAEIVPVIEAHRRGQDRRPDDVVRQYLHEARLIQAGSWYPGVKAPRGANRQLAEDITGVPSPVHQSITQADQKLDSILESSNE